MREIDRLWVAQAICNLLGVLVGLGYASLTFLPGLDAAHLRALGAWAGAVLVASYVVVPLALCRISRPAADAFEGLKTGALSPDEISDRALRRAVNAPIIALGVSVLTWIVCALSAAPAWAISSLTWSVGFVAHLAATIALVGLWSSVFVYYLVESRVRDRILPVLLSGGRLDEVKGAIPVPLTAKLGALLLTTGTLPVAVLAISAAVDRVGPGALLYLAAAFLGIGGLQAVYIRRSLVGPLERLRAEMSDVQDGDLEARAPVESLDAVGALAQGFNDMVEGLRRAAFLKDTFGRYVSEPVMEEILQGRVQLGGEVRTATVLFSDLRGFTALSERLGPEALVAHLNRYLDGMVQVVVAHGGTIDKFIGDSIMATFGAPVSRPDDPDRAVRAALEMLAELDRFNQRARAEGRPELEMGIGVHTGSVVAGLLGSRQKLEYTVVGDTVNTASRIEQLNKRFGSRLLISHETYQSLDAPPPGRARGPVSVKGRRAPVRVWELAPQAETDAPSSP